MNLQDLRYKALFDRLLKYSFKRGDFTLSSGKKASYYMDARKTTLSAEGAKLIGEILFEKIAPFHIQAVGGLSLGADPIVTAVSLTSFLKHQAIEGFLIRKETKSHGTGRQIEGNLSISDRVVLVEDVMTTGGSFIKAIEAVKAFSADISIVKCIALVDRDEGGKEALNSLQIQVEALFPIDAFLEADVYANPIPGS